ncbi:PLP-dependent aminotransferase family protein [Nocardia terpenica]|uniref:aminotransferase-like domain-containing protein n=1 Tax=Nocardia terpenica TaxID=455432 RepID=UPI0018D4E1A2|nr:PLP-dependent aminotransferase family protein [Nocardia terpenica]
MSNDSSSRIVAELREWMATAPPGAQLPSTRALVARYGASPVTVQKALRTLSAQGMVESRSGVGTFVRAVRVARPHDYGWQTAALGSPDHRIPPLPTALRTAPNDAIALHGGYPDRELLPERLVRAAFGRAARTGAAVGRPPAAGLPELQAWFATELGAAAPVGVVPPTPSDVVVLPGSQSGLSTAFRALVGAGRPLLIESPTYWGAILAAAQAGVQLVPVPSGSHGPDPDELARAFERTGARACYVQPNFANPTGAHWSSATADRVLEVARRFGAFLVEDDWAHDLGITAESTPLAARDDNGHVVYLRSLTKSVSPAVRIAAIIARGPARERILADTQAQSMYASGILQAVALDVVTQPGWRTHLRALRQPGWVTTSSATACKMPLAYMDWAWVSARMRSRAGPRTHPRRHPGPIHVCQRHFAGRRARRRHPARLAHPSARPAPAAGRPPRPAGGGGARTGRHASGGGAARRPEPVDPPARHHGSAPARPRLRGRRGDDRPGLGMVSRRAHRPLPATQLLRPEPGGLPRRGADHRPGTGGRRRGRATVNPRDDSLRT